MNKQRGAWFFGWFVTRKGSSKSGNWGHKGRKGKRGGSAPGGGGRSNLGIFIDDKLEIHDAIGAYSDEDITKFKQKIEDVLKRHPPKAVQSISAIHLHDDESFDADCKKFGFDPDETASYATIQERVNDDGTVTILEPLGLHFTSYLPDHIVDHEIGHAVYYRSSPRAREVWDQAYNGPKPFDRWTEYSKNDKSEGFAESYAGFINVGGKSSAREVQRVFDVIQGALNDLPTS